MKLIASRQLRGEYGLVVPDQEFEARDEVAVELIKKGLAHRPDPPKIQYQAKIIRPEAPEVSPREPFRGSPVPHEEPPTVAPESNRIVPQPDVPASEDADRRRRGRRPGSGS